MLISIIRTVILYIFILLALRIMGKRQLSEMQTSELVITLLISDIAVIPMQNTGQPLLSGIVPILILISLEILFSVIMLKSGNFRKIVCGSPEMVIKDGKILQDQMRRLRMTTEDLCVQLRQQGIFSLEDVQYCIVETNGDVSVLEKPDKRTPSAEDLGIEIPDKGIEAVVINDSRYLSNSLELCSLTKEWVDSVLRENDITIDEVFIMTANRDKEYNIIRRD
ncbi:MAG: DUF421 domain-containing protein [Oscillospiraceae bacterium]|nr:DUF421 domain-containing protein [Oscillospiraceae bacterium]